MSSDLQLPLTKDVLEALNELTTCCVVTSHFDALHVVSAHKIDTFIADTFIASSSPPVSQMTIMNAACCSELLERLVKLHAETLRCVNVASARHYVA